MSMGWSWALIGFLGATSPAPATLSSRTRRIRAAPHEKDAQRVKGTVEVDVPSGTLRSVDVQPSENPTFVDEMVIDMTSTREPVLHIVLHQLS